MQADQPSRKERLDAWKLAQQQNKGKPQQRGKQQGKAGASIAATGKPSVVSMRPRDPLKEVQNSVRPSAQQGFAGKGAVPARGETKAAAARFTKAQVQAGSGNAAAVKAGVAAASTGQPASDKHLQKGSKAAGAAAEAAQRRVPKSPLLRVKDPEHMAAMSDILRTNVEQAEAIQKIGGTEAALTLLEVLAKSRIYKDVTEFALYWAARARLHEDDGNWRIARSILDEGDAYMSLTPQKMVLGKIIAAFEKRCHEALNQLVDDATTTAGGGGGAAAAAPATKAAAGAWAGPSAEKNTQHGSRASEEEQCNSSQQSFGASPMTAGYRLDPNDASFDSNDLGSTGGGINKALTFAAATSTAASHSEGHAETLEATAAMQASTAREGGISGGTMSSAQEGAVPENVLFSDDEQDDLSELNSSTTSSSGGNRRTSSLRSVQFQMDTIKEDKQSEAQAVPGQVEDIGTPAAHEREQLPHHSSHQVTGATTASAADISTPPPMDAPTDMAPVTSPEPARKIPMPAVQSAERMPPPPPRSGQANKLKKKRAPTPHPSGRRPRRRTSTAGDTIDIGADGAEEGGSCGMDCGSSDAPSDVDASGGGESTAALATAKGSKRVATPIVRRVGGKDGGDNESNRAPAASKRVGTPIVRRSERISSVNKHAHAPTPSPLKREMEMMLG